MHDHDHDPIDTVIPNPNSTFCVSISSLRRTLNCHPFDRRCTYHLAHYIYNGLCCCRGGNLRGADDDWFSWIASKCSSRTVMVVIGICTAFYFYYQSRVEIKRVDGRRRRALAGSNMKFHVLIPCHVESDRRALLFFRCMQSVAMQAFHEEFEVFISLSGPALYREKVTVSLKTIETKSSSSNATWHLHDSKKNAMPQMEHLRCLVKISAGSDPNARLMFLDNDDMFHPLRLNAFQEALMNLQELPLESPLPLSCKLLLNENVGPNEGKLTDLVSSGDNFAWKKNPSLSRKVQWVPTSRSDEMDATEYMDFMVPTSVMEEFFRLTPVGITSHRFCDLRLLAILERICPMEVADIPHYPWLLAHYKTSMGTKLRNFDMHGNGSALSAHSLDQASVGTHKPSAKDVALSKRFKKLSPGQVAMCRGHLESTVVQFIGWDDTVLAEEKKTKIDELNRWHGPGLGDALWKEVITHMSSLFKGNEINLNRGEWKRMSDGC